jgi:hypothetical protein
MPTRIRALALAAVVFAMHAPARAQTEANVDAQYAALAAPAPAASPNGAALAAAITPYAAFQRDIAKLRGFTPKRAADVETALDKMAGHGPDALARGWIAYGALAAARSPAYIEEIRKVEKAYGREKAVTWFSTIPHYPKTLAGFAEARDYALKASVADAGRLTQIGSELRGVARGLDRTPWASQALPAKATAARRKRLNDLSTKAKPVLAPEVAARLGALASNDPNTDSTAIGAGHFWDVLETGAATATQVAMPTAPTADASHASAFDAMASLAALHILGAVHEAPPAALDALIGHKFTSECFKRASLAYAQCVSAGRFHKENVACIAAEAIESRAQCVGSIAGAK